MAKTRKTKEQPKPQFRPGANYVWEPDAEFVLSGKEFEFILNALKSNFKNPEFVAHIDQFNAYKLMEQLFMQGIEDGVITELPEQPTTAVQGAENETNKAK